MKEKTVSYSHSNTYSTLNRLSPKTKNIWLVCHGMGYLSRYFIQYFKDLDPDENYIIAPQAASKYYQDKKFTYVGASWLTKENTPTEKQNVLRYLDEVWTTESAQWQQQDIKLICMGYSQGVSIITRWLAHSKVSCDYLLLHSGAIPKELKPTDFNFLAATTPVVYLYGNKDAYITEARTTEQQLIGTALFGDRLLVKVFEGVHEVNVEFLLGIAMV